MKENSIEKLQERLETLHVIQDARLACNADDLDIREEIAEVEEEIKELQDDTNVDRENSIKNERSSIKEDIERLKLCSTNQCNICGRYEKEECMLERNRCEQHILSDYKRALKELEEKTTILLAGAEKVKQLEKENEELNLKYHMLYTEKIDKQKAQEVKIKSQVISIQKVKDKIDEILNNGEYRIIFEGDAEFPDEATIITGQKYIKLEKLQELLEGRK